MNYAPINGNYALSKDYSQEEEPETDSTHPEGTSPDDYPGSHLATPNYVATYPRARDDDGQPASGSDLQQEAGGTEYEAELGFVGNATDLTGGSQLTVEAVPKDDSWRQTVKAHAPGVAPDQTAPTIASDQQSPATGQNPDAPAPPAPQTANTESLQGVSTDSASSAGVGAIDGAGAVQGEVAGPRTLAPNQFPVGEPNPALIESGRVHVDALQSAGTLDAARASAILADDGYLQQIGTLLAQPGSEAARAVEVLISDTGSSGGPADRYVSGLARSGAISLDEFKVLANDIDFLGNLTPLFADPEASAPASPQADEQTLIRIAGQDLGNGNQGFIGADGLIVQEGATADTAVDSSISVDGSATIEQPEPLAEDAITIPHYITAGGAPFPPELQARLDEGKASGGIDPTTLRAAQVLSGTVASSPVEQFLAQSYMGGHIDIDTYIGHLHDPDFLTNPQNEVAAEALLGTAQDHDASEDFMNKIFADGHITFEQYISDLNDPEKMAALDRGVAEGKVVYENEGFGSTEAVLINRSEDEIKALLHPGVNLNDGPPSAEQIAALNQLAEGLDQRFVELTTQWVQHHNPGYDLQFGHPTQEAKDAGEPASFFWTNNGQKVDDAFLNSLTSELSSPDGELHFDTKGLHVDPDLENALMTEVRIKYEGVTRKPTDELTDDSRHLESIIYAHDDPGEMDNLKNRLRNTDGIPIGIDDHYDGEYPVDATNGKVRAALDAIDPSLTDGVQIHWIKGKDGVEIANPTQLEETVVYIEESKNIRFNGNDGPLTFLAFDYENVSGGNGSGDLVAVDQSAPIVHSTADPNVPKVDPERIGFLDGKVDSALLDPESRQTIQDIMSSADPITVLTQSERLPFAGLPPEERLYVYDKATQQIGTAPAEHDAGSDTTNTTEATSLAQTTPEQRQQYLEQYADYLLQEIASLPPDQALGSEEIIAVIAGIVEGDTELSAAEGEYLVSYASQQLGVAAAPQLESMTNDPEPPDSAYQQVDVAPTGRDAELDTVAATLYEHFGSVEDVATAFGSDPDLQAYPAEERAIIVDKVVQLDAQNDSNQENAIAEYEIRKQERADDSNPDWDQIAIAAKRDHTINGDQFDTDAFLQAVENEDDLLPTREAKDYVIETTLEFAENGDLTLV